MDQEDYRSFPIRNIPDLEILFLHIYDVYQIIGFFSDKSIDIVKLWKFQISKFQKFQIPKTPNKENQ